MVYNCKWFFYIYVSPVIHILFSKFPILWFGRAKKIMRNLKYYNWYCYKNKSILTLTKIRTENGEYIHINYKNAL